MASPEAAEALVSARDWIRGIALSVLASMIGGASKLLIRKSWLIDAKRKGRPPSEEDSSHHSGSASRRRDAYDEVSSPTGSLRKPAVPLHRGFGSESSLVAPLEVGSPERVTDRTHHHVHAGESFSSNDDGEAAPDDGGGCFFNADPLLASCGNGNLITNSTASRISQKKLSWILYLGGMIGMSVLNPLCCVLAMKYANPSILAPFSGLTLVWVVLFSGMAVDEHPGRMQILACSLIVAGEVLVAAFGDHTNGEERGVDDVLASYRAPGFRTFVVFMTLFLVQLVIFIRVCPKTSLLRKVAWGSIGGSITGFQNFLKDALTIFDATMSQRNDHGIGTDSLPAAFFLFVALAMGTAFVGLLCLAACMRRYDATYSAAMFVASFVVSASLMSFVHYSTFAHLNGAVSMVLYPLGLATLFLGAFVLVKPGAARGWCHVRSGSSGWCWHPNDEGSRQRERLLCGD